MIYCNTEKSENTLSYYKIVAHVRKKREMYCKRREPTKDQSSEKSVHLAFSNKECDFKNCNTEKQPCHLPEVQLTKLQNVIK
jgi:hypothetical protein